MCMIIILTNDVADNALIVHDDDTYSSEVHVPITEMTPVLSQIS